MGVRAKTSQTEEGRQESYRSRPVRSLFRGGGDVRLPLVALAFVVVVGEQKAWHATRPVPRRLAFWPRGARDSYVRRLIGRTDGRTEAYRDDDAGRQKARVTVDLGIDQLHRAAVNSLCPASEQVSSLA
jgi:hypothetical protein